MLVDPGPTPTLATLERGLEALGLTPADIQAICLTHVHLDHAGATGAWVRAHPHVRVWVHEDGSPHLADPDRLVRSTRRTFGDAHDRLWGEVTPVPPANLRPWRPGAEGPRGFTVVPTPGHIGHHLSYLHDASGTLLAGDALGLVLASGAPTHPTTPPPAVQVDRWRDTLARLGEIGAPRVGVAHFGIHPADDRVDQMAAVLEGLVQRVRAAMERDDAAERARFAADARALQATTRPADEVDAYFRRFRAEMDWDGVQFWLERNAP